MRITNLKYSAELRQQGLLKGSTSEIIEGRPQMSLCWKQLVLRRCVLTATALSPLVFNPDDGSVRRLLSEERTGSPASQKQRHTRVRPFQDEHISDKRTKNNQWGTRIQWQEAKARGRGFFLGCINAEHARAVLILRWKNMKYSREHGPAKILFLKYNGMKEDESEDRTLFSY